MHRLAVGQADVTGDDFGGIFASSIGGEHRGAPLGIADVSWNNCAWSIKTVKSNRVITQEKVRAISGRNSPKFSHHIKDPFLDIQATGSAVLAIWNDRVDEAFAEYDDLRIVVFLRDMCSLEFGIFEVPAERYVPNEFEWVLNKGENFEAYDVSGVHRFTWQPHGSQFTVIYRVPKSARYFRLAKSPMIISEEAVLASVGYEDSWCTFVSVKEALDL